MASSRKRSISTGRSCEKITASLHVAADHVFVVGDHHGAAAQHVAGTHQHGIPDATRDLAGFFGAGGRAVRRRWDIQIVEQIAEEFAIFRQIDIRRIGADDGHAGAL